MTRIKHLLDSERNVASAHIELRQYRPKEFESGDFDATTADVVCSYPVPFATLPTILAAPTAVQISSKALLALESTVKDSAWRRATVDAQNVHFRYQNNSSDWILNGLDMSVPPASIYGLLGPSGCGKSTLLRLLVGCLQVNSGRLNVFGHPPGPNHGQVPGHGVGYMPQELALYPDLTISEILIYYGRLYRIDWSTLCNRIDSLCQLLQLQGHHRQPIESLSGGEQRRVSLCIALLHQPPLIILDEPTVGVDPVLRVKIWSHLRSLVEQSGTTVLITTHYVEEARHANVVGLMRRGRLLAEHSPDQLLHMYKSPTIEQVFLRLCQNEKSMSNKKSSTAIDLSFNRVKAMIDRRTQQVTASSGLSGALDLPFDGESVITCPNQVGYDNRSFESDESNANGSATFAHDCDSLNLARPPAFAFSRSDSVRNWCLPVFAILKKNLKRNFRHPALIAFQFLLPLSQLALFCICVGHEPFHTRIAVVDQEPTDSLRLGQRFVELIDRYYVHPIEYDSLELAWADARRTRVWAVLHVPAGFSEVLAERVSLNETLSGHVLRASGAIRLHADVTDKLRLISIERSLFQSMGRLMRELADEQHSQPQLAASPIRVQHVIYGQLQHPQHAAYREYFAPGFAASVTFALAYGLTCVLLMLERDQGTFERHLLAGISAAQILTAHALSRAVFLLPQAAAALLLLKYVFELPLRGSFIFAWLLLVLVALCGLSLGLLISAVCRQLNTAAVFACAILFYVFFVTGVAWPLQAFPAWLRTYSLLHPTTLANEAIRSVMLRGWTVTHPGVYLGILSASGWTLFLFLIGRKFFKFF